jgi:hypothetical protein
MTKASMPTLRQDFGVGVVSGVLNTVGGRAGSGLWSATVEAYDPVANSWTTKAPPSGRYAVGFGVVHGVLYAVGGYPWGAGFLPRPRQRARGVSPVGQQRHQESGADDGSPRS